jgi:choline dehydrogenase-like flavoprotein
LFEVAIIGSGPAGAAAAMALRGRNVLVLDVGFRAPERPGISGGFYAAKREPESNFDALIGERFESLHNVDGANLMPKIKAPLRRFVIQDSRRLAPILSDNFDGFLSFAIGGLANAWGAQLYRFDAEDLRDFPISVAELEPHYAALTEHIGISGADDDLSRFYGSTAGLLPAHNLSPVGEAALRGYEKRRAFFNRNDVYMGMPRLGLLTQKHGKRPPHDYANVEFFNPDIPSVYTPKLTFDELLKSPDAPQYLPNRLVQAFRQTDNGVTLSVRNLADDSVETYQAKHLLLGAGALGSARLVLQSQENRSAKLPILENLLSYIPFVNPRLIGAAQSEQSFYTQANLCVHQIDGSLVTGTFYAISGLLHADLLFDLPLSSRANMMALKYILPSMLVLHLWYPARPQSHNHLSLGPNDELVIDYADRVTGDVEQKLIRLFRRAGQFSLPRLCKFPKPGQSFHYAGTLPMRENPGPFETDRWGRLHGSDRVRVIDGAAFPSLPAKNLSFTIMANAMRIATQLRRELASA